MGVLRNTKDSLSWSQCISSQGRITFHTMPWNPEFVVGSGEQLISLFYRMQFLHWGYYCSSIGMFGFDSFRPSSVHVGSHWSRFSMYYLFLRSHWGSWSYFWPRVELWWLSLFIMLKNANKTHEAWLFFQFSEYAMLQQDFSEVRHRYLAYLYTALDF